MLLVLVLVLLLQMKTAAEMIELVEPRKMTMKVKGRSMWEW
jgi:hypothetical protein